MTDKTEPQSRIHYSTNGDGTWWKTTWEPQCQETVFLMGQCQGTKGHSGVHWRFDERGNFEYSDNDADSTEDGCCGTIPPSHATYRTPLEMEPHHHSEHHHSVQVTDPDKIARLNRGELDHGESMTRPVGIEGMEYPNIENDA